MSLLFCRVVKQMLEANAGFAAAVPGGLYPDGISKHEEDPREQCVGVYWSGGSVPMESVSRTMPIESATMNIRLEADTIDELTTAGNAMAAVVFANRAGWSAPDGTRVAKLRFTRGETREVPHPDAADRSVRQADFSITGFCPIG